MLRNRYTKQNNHCSVLFVYFFFPLLNHSEMGHMAIKTQKYNFCKLFLSSTAHGLSLIPVCSQYCPHFVKITVKDREKQQVTGVEEGNHFEQQQDGWSSCPLRHSRTLHPAASQVAINKDTSGHGIKHVPFSPSARSY